MSKRDAKEAMQAELAQLQRGVAVLQCIRHVVLYDNDAGVDLNDALTIALEVISRAAFKLDSLTTKLVAPA